MAKAVKYRGQFRSRKNILYRVDILVEGFSGAQPYTMTLSDNNPVTINWASAKKEQPVVGSELSLTVISTTDRQYLDLYTKTPGAVAIEVYRYADSVNANGTVNPSPQARQIFWKGTMDTEFYSEPYNMTYNYPVSFTFTDFGILDRMPFDVQGIQPTPDIISFYDIIEAVLRKTGMYDGTNYNVPSVISSYVALKLNDETLTPQKGLYISTQNFYDEDGEPMTMREALNAFLQPLGLKITQRNGRIYIFDIDGLCNASRLPITWADSNQKLSADNVYNNIDVTFSTYADAEIMKPAEVTNEGTNPETYYDVFSRSGYAGGYFSFFHNGVELDQSLTKDSLIARFCIKSHGTGEDCCGVYATYSTTNPQLNQWPTQRGHVPHGADYAEDLIIMTTARKRIYGNGFDRSRYFLRLCVEQLIDTRYNPFETPPDRSREKEVADKIEESTAICMVPAKVVLYGDDGNTYHLTNKTAAESKPTGTLSIWSSSRQNEPNVTWTTVGTGDPVITSGGTNIKNVSCDFWLSYYEKQNQESSPAVGGWKTNQHTVGIFVADGKTTTFNRQLEKMDEGQIIPAPPVSGEIEITIYSTFFCYSAGDLKAANASTLGRVFYGSRMDKSSRWFYDNLYKEVRWHLCKTPTLTWLNKDFEEVDQEDLEMSGTIKTDAKDELKLTTKCGTTNDWMPTSRATYLVSNNGYKVQLISNGKTFSTAQLSRADVIDSSEHLLINCLYSQYAERHQKLEGTIDTTNNQALIPYVDTMPAVTDRDPNPAARVYMELSRSENLSDDTAKVTLCEISPSTYTPIQ